MATDDTQAVRLAVLGTYSTRAKMTKKLKINEAKEYVAGKLGIDIIDLTDEEVMHQLREDLGIGLVTSVSGSPKGIRAKMKIAELLDIRINSVELFKSQTGYHE